ncbi:hypothetical protein Acr_05g0011830 [Actinidia rufa]|uniref:Uncharacterized protein n=1 Tax=Actinidia rufa TaxID=165716 RepID=A0A7J0EM43_9ERIC|nr:hypothetical protein Acr_05g0011830 [Actinidia rufa]
MGTLEEEKLFQMVHDFIEYAESPPPISTSPNHHAKCYLLQEILGSSTDAEAEVSESVLKHMRNKMDSKKTKWLVMMLKKDGYNASLCQTSWPTTLGCPSGDYEYLDIVMEDENGTSQRLIVDIDFKSQFELARPTTTYKDLTARLPPVFVGDEQKLNRTVSLLCSAAKQSLGERGLHIPPWRTSTYMHSKWLSHCCHKDNLNREAKLDPIREILVKPKRRGFRGSGLLVESIL